MFSQVFQSALLLFYFKSLELNFAPELMFVLAQTDLTSAEWVYLILL